MNLPPALKKYGIYRVAFSEAAPVSGVPEVVLAREAIRLLTARIMVTWTVQPNPLQLHIDVDGEPSIISFANPVTATPYYWQGWDESKALTAQVLGGTSTVMKYMNGIAEGRIEVKAETTGGTVNPLACWLTYQKLR